MKIYFYPEGDNEVDFINNIFAATGFREKSKLIESEPEFIKETAKKELLYFIDIPEGVDRIPFRLNDIYKKFKKGGCETFIIICDVENELGHPSARKSRIEESLKSYIRADDIKYIFSCPYLEEIYWDHPTIIKKIMRIFYQDKSPNDRVPQFVIPNKPSSKFKDELFELFNYYRLHFKKDRFSYYFFSKLNYFTSGNSTVKRLITLIRVIFKRVV